MHIGSTISHYKIVAKLGEGGMGVVYKAEDTQLRRTVALKFLSRETLDDEDVKARLVREAQAAAGLDHPNICHVYGIHEEDGETFIAMAYIDGPSLAEKIKERPLPLDEALAISAQIAEGLHEAHEQGVVHRDIKPQNILLTAKGQVKILDFGLAALTGRSKLTKTGTTLGTPAYMSPEQLEGKEVDLRTDLWALGCVLYEMLTQKTPFAADYEQAIGYGILNEDPEPVSARRSGLPTEIDRVIGKALAKDPAERYQHADELLTDLRVLRRQSVERKPARPADLTTGVPAAMTGAHTLNPAAVLSADAVVMQRSSQRALLGLAGIATLLLLALAFVHFTEAAPASLEQTVRRFSFAPEGLAEAMISPNGKYIIYGTQTDGESSLWLRSLNDESARELPGTEGAIYGFWSPDSSSIGFAAGSPGYQLKRVSIDGGSPITLCELPAQTSFLGGTWSPDSERIVFSSGGKLYEIASRGGEPQLLIDESAGPQRLSAFPHFLPAGDGPAALVYRTATSLEDGAIAVLNLETGEHRELGPGARPAYSEPGYLIHGAANGAEPGLWALPFSLAKLEPTGEAFPIATDGSAATVSHDGTLVYRNQALFGTLQTLVWRSRTGELLETVGQPQLSISQPALSPDGQRVAVGSAENGNRDIWVHDLSRSTKTRLTFEDQTEADPAWSPYGRDIVYWQQGSPQRIMRRAADGTGDPAVLVESATAVRNPDWSTDGRYLLYQQRSLETRYDIRYLELEADGSASDPVTFLATPADEVSPKLSPDGRFLTYVSNESGRSEIYVCPFPGGDGKWQASVSSGSNPRWSRDGKELYYVRGGTLMAVRVSTESVFSLGPPQPLFQTPGLIQIEGVVGSRGGYEVSADGNRFLTSALVEDAAEAAPPTIRIVQNWYEEFRDREQ